MKFDDGMTCPICEIGSLAEKVEDIEFEYKGVTRTFPGQRIFQCSGCGESLQNKKDQRLLDRALTDSRRKIDGLLTAREIKSIREQFKMTQVEFARLLRVGEKNFARYENGQTTQGRAMDNLLRILHKHPHTINEIGGVWAEEAAVNA